jgi:hypothetical protein
VVDFARTIRTIPTILGLAFIDPYGTGQIDLHNSRWSIGVLTFFPWIVGIVGILALVVAGRDPSGTTSQRERVKRWYPSEQHVFGILELPLLKNRIA